MRYEAYRFEENVVGIGRCDGWVVRGQRSTDLNWSVLTICKTREEAETKARELRDNVDLRANRNYCPVYDPGGYAIEGTY